MHVTQGVTPANEVTWKQLHYKLFLVAEGTSSSDTGWTKEQRELDKSPAGPLVDTDPLPKTLESSVELL